MVISTHGVLLVLCVCVGGGRDVRRRVRDGQVPVRRAVQRGRPRVGAHPEPPAGHQRRGCGQDPGHGRRHDGDVAGDLHVPGARQHRGHHHAQPPDGGRDQPRHHRRRRRRGVRQRRGHGGHRHRPGVPRHRLQHRLCLPARGRHCEQRRVARRGQRRRLHVHDRAAQPVVRRRGGLRRDGVRDEPRGVALVVRPRGLHEAHGRAGRPGLRGGPAQRGLRQVPNHLCFPSWLVVSLTHLCVCAPAAR